MRLLLVTHYFPAHGGGVEAVAMALASRLVAERRAAIEWWASDVDIPPGHRADSPECHAVPAWNGIERWLGAPMPIWSPRSLVGLWVAVGNADVVHIHDALYFGNAFAALFARIRRKPLVVTQHIGTVPYRSRALRVAHWVANRTLGRAVLGSAMQVMFVSPTVRDEFSSFVRFRATPRYLANGIDRAVFHAGGDMADLAPLHDVRRRAGRIFLFVGRFVEKKGLAVLRALATEFKDDYWLFAGAGPMDPDDWQLSNVSVIRGVSGQSLACWYRAADLLVLPSRGEGFPLVVQEAMACGTPAMVGAETAAGCPAARGLLLAAETADDRAAEAWTSALRDRTTELGQLRARRAEVAAFAAATWSWDLVVAEYSQLFERLTTEQGR